MSTSATVTKILLELGKELLQLENRRAIIKNLVNSYYNYGIHMPPEEFIERYQQMQDELKEVETRWEKAKEEVKEDTENVKNL